MSDEMTFFTGDLVVYPTHGVGRVEAVECQEIAGQSLEFIVITFTRDRMILRVPVTKGRNLGGCARFRPRR